tara:strand:+ start:190 stop:429 length:240 start_codon:yes stop_codon:yes gene_type:complete
MYQLLLEAFVVGGGFAVLGIVISHIYLNYILKTKDRLCLDIINNDKLIKLFFVSGFLFHFFCEFTGINKWYCKNGNACQ